MDFLNTPTFKILQKSLDVTWERMNVTAQNIANINTPHYKAKKLEFESVLMHKLGGSNVSYALNMRYSGEKGSQRLADVIDSSSPVIYRDNKTETRVDGNNVDIDYENLELARTKIQYDYLVRKITDEYNLLKYAVTEGKG